MMSERASSFPPVNTSWMRVAQRTLELFTHVKSTGRGRTGGWVGEQAPEAEPLTVGPGQVQPRLQDRVSVQQPECQKPTPEASLTGVWQLAGCSLPKSSRRGLPQQSSG